ncbi:MAG: hypothetical protein KDJ97_23095, partial [Anaerolineae bacterium]|nr:hypothetical protein [Anaerolineae bacterium]
MMAESGSNLLDLLTLPPLQRDIIIYLTRNGSANAATLAERLELQPEEVEHALADLADREHLRLSDDGQAQPTLGRTRRRTLPARLWPALLAA